MVNYSKNRQDKSLQGPYYKSNSRKLELGGIRKSKKDGRKTREAGKRDRRED